VDLKPYLFSMQSACAILSFVACPAAQYFSTLSHKQHDYFFLGGGGLLSTKCAFLFPIQLLSEIFLILRKTERYDKKCILVFM